MQRPANTGLKAVAKAAYFAKLRKQTDDRFASIMSLVDKRAGLIPHQRFEERGVSLALAVAILQLYGFHAEATDNDTSVVYAKARD